MPIIQIKPVELVWYRDAKLHTFWLNADVADSFLQALKKWKKLGGGFRVTETLRTVERQKRLKKMKPALACAPGWSLHGHGRAVDFDVRTVGVGNIIAFYEVMAEFGWFAIFNAPSKPIIYKPRESWHLQKTEPVGISSRRYLEEWARKNGGRDSLLNLRYERVNTQSSGGLKQLFAK